MKCFENQSHENEYMECMPCKIADRQLNHRDFPCLWQQRPLAVGCTALGYPMQTPTGVEQLEPRRGHESAEFSIVNDSI